MASCTASFQESSAQVGQTIHVDFTWTDAVLNTSPYLHTAYMQVMDPNQNICASLDVLSEAGSATLECVTDEAGTWSALIAVWDGTTYVHCTESLLVSPGSTGSLVYREGASVVVGTTIHADCMWQNAASGGSYYATMKIEDPTFTICDYHNETQNATGAHTLSCVTDMTGTWIAELKIWNGSDWVMLFETIQVTSANAPTAVIDEPVDGATVNNPVYFVGHGVSNAGGQITQYAWFDGGVQISAEPSFITTLSIGQHDIGLVVFCNIGGWSEYVWITITVGTGISCWECLTPGSPCEQTTGHTICDGITTFSTQAACENATGCGSVDCWKCQTPGSPCVLTSWHASCNGTSTFNTQAECHTGTGCESGNGDDCITHQNQSDCETAGCFWYAYPNPFGEPSCHEKGQIEANIPLIIAGIGGLIITYVLLSKPKRAPYYPPPQPRQHREVI